MKRYLYEKSVAIQISDITTITRDWNCDGDIYPIKGVWIEWEQDQSREFISLDHLEMYFKPL